MKTYKVAIAYEEGFSMEVQANSEAEAKAKALELVDEHAWVEIKGMELDTVHRDYFTC